MAVDLMATSDRHHSCSFCGKGRPEVTKFIQGSGATICDRCVVECDNFLHGKTAGIQLAQPQVCGFCGQPEAAVNFLLEGSVGYICNHCVAILKEVLDKEAGLQPRPLLRHVPLAPEEAEALSSIDELAAAGRNEIGPINSPTR